jgi:RpiB/LacA/LacB family sugar-phosphate isomerase
LRRIHISSDHVSLILKEAVVQHLKQRGCTVIDHGTFSADVIVDYHDYAQKVALAVAAEPDGAGIVICGTGLGASIAANKVRGVRAALCHDVFTAHQARAHNDANILAMGGWVVSPQRMPWIVDEWLNTPFEGGRHTARVIALDRHIPISSDSQPEFDPNQFKYAMALSIKPTLFGPVLFGGRLEKGLEALSSAGFDHVELSLRNADDLPFDELEHLLSKYHLKVSALATGQGCIHDQLCLVATDPGLHQAALKRLEAIIELSSKLHAAVILGGVRGKLAGSVEEQAAQKAMFSESVLHCSRHAEKFGVPLLLEAINRYETNLINTATEAVAFIKEIGVPNIKVLLDTFHMNIEEVDIPTTIRMTGDRLGYLHIVDSNRQAPGQGHVDIKAILSALAGSGYQGFISAEILPLPDDASAVLRTANYLESLGVKMPNLD